jgi:hypothetical protein
MNHVAGASESVVDGNSDMTAIWSFWSKPYHDYYKTFWLSHEQYLLSWVLSVREARKHFTRSALCTDDGGADLLINRLQLPFDHVSTTLNVLEKRDPKWFGLGKLYAYRQQHRPFLHIDNDVFLWKPLSWAATHAEVVAQNWEPFLFGDSCYRIETISYHMRKLCGIIPRELDEYLPGSNGCRAVNCGVLGGTHVGFLQYYADLAIELIEHPRNRRVWESIDNGVLDSVFVEQFMLEACLEFCRRHTESAFAGIDVHVLFESLQHAYHREAAEKVGLTHLIGTCKKNELVASQITRLVRKLYPEDYARVIELSNRQ